MTISISIDRAAFGIRVGLPAQCLPLAFAHRRVR